jgi:hypothetical protein
VASSGCFCGTQVTFSRRYARLDTPADGKEGDG